MKRRDPLGDVLKRRDPLGDVYGSRYADCGLAMVWFLARMQSGLTLAKIGEQAGGVGYKPVQTSIRRFTERLERDRELRDLIEE